MLKKLYKSNILQHKIQEGLELESLELQLVFKSKRKAGTHSVESRDVCGFELNPIATTQHTMCSRSVFLNSRLGSFTIHRSCL